MGYISNEDKQTINPIIGCIYGQFGGKYLLYFNIRDIDRFNKSEVQRNSIALI